MAWLQVQTLFAVVLVLVTHWTEASGPSSSFVSSSYTFNSTSGNVLGPGQVKPLDPTDDSTMSSTDSTEDILTSTSEQSSKQSVPDHIQHRIRRGEVQVKGANLGGWLIPEHWMTSTARMWTGASQKETDAGLYKTLTAHRQMSVVDDFEEHMKTFVTEETIAKIAEQGLNTVRVPVGYWIVGNDTEDPSGQAEWKVYPEGTVSYVDTLIKVWAKKHNIAVELSIHAAKGSQNGNDHSSPTDPGKTYWSKYPENVRNTINVATFLADRYKDEDAFLGIGLLNEPNGDTDEKVLYQYYQDAYAAVRKISPDCILTIMPLLWKQDCKSMAGFMEAPQYTNVWVEWHPYFIWGNEQTSAQDLVSKTIATDYQAKMTEWNARPNANKLFFGEWSLASTGQFSNVDAAFENWARAQIKIMNQAKGGWTYWSWHVSGDEAEGSFNAWSMKNVMDKDNLKAIIMS